MDAKERLQRWDRIIMTLCIELVLHVAKHHELDDDELLYIVGELHEWLAQHRRYTAQELE